MHAMPKPTSHLHGSGKKDFFGFRGCSYRMNAGTSLAYDFIMTTDMKDSWLQEHRIIKTGLPRGELSGLHFRAQENVDTYRAGRNEDAVGQRAPI